MDDIWKELNDTVENFMNDIDDLKDQLKNAYDVKREGAKYSMMIENMDYIKREYIPKEEIRKKIRRCQEIENELNEIYEKGALELNFEKRKKMYDRYLKLI